MRAGAGLSFARRGSRCREETSGSRFLIPVLVFVVVVVVVVVERRVLVAVVLKDVLVVVVVVTSGRALVVASTVSGLSWIEGEAQWHQKGKGAL
jgi:hypothetical protein